MPDKTPIDFKSLHAQAQKLVKEDAIFAYAVAKELRKFLVARPSDAAKHELMSHLARSTWNKVVKLQECKNDSDYTSEVLTVLTETIILAYDILTEKIGYVENN